MRPHLTILGILTLAGTAAVGSVAGSAANAGAAPRAKEAKPVAGPLVMGHRGASGYRPEHTLASYELAARMGADFIEPDVVATKDGVLVVRHENDISGTTDVADHPEFAARRSTKTVDGVGATGWFTEDFTLAELRTLRAKERLPAVRQENTLYDGRWTVPTLQEVFELRERLSKELGRTVGIIPETKHPTYFTSIGLPLEAKLVKMVRAFKLDKAKAPIVIQSFELNNLVELREHYALKAPLVFLTSTSGKGFGDTQTYAELLTPAGLTTISAWVNSIGPDKNQVIPRTADGSLGAPSSLVADAHAAGLTVIPYTFRAENTFLPTNLRVGTNPNDFGRAITEDVTFMRTGIDGLFCDQPDICVEARAEFNAG
jgi:glycerophosphoryl diester phosphodiesterase